MTQSFVTFRDLVDESERVELQNYAMELKEKRILAPNPMGPNRFFRCIWGSPLVTPLVQEVASRIERKFSLEGIQVDAELGWVISVIYHGGHIHTHTDSKLYRGRPFKHLRCNVVVSRPDSGGVPIIGKQPVPLLERGGWAFFASEIEHSATAVDGAKPRIVYQFGYSVPSNWSLPALD